MNRKSVRTLIGHQHVPIGLRCLGSLLSYSSEPLSLVVHDDGTLTGEDKGALVSGLPGASILSRDEANERVLPLLARYPKCQAYRKLHPLALKLIDMALLETEDLAYCDSDVLFLKPYTKLFDWPNEQCAAIFMQDIQNAYSLRPWHMHPIGSLRMPRNLNTGLMLFRASRYDLDFIEWMLGQSRLEQVFKKRTHWIEQTCWAALGWKVGCHLWDARQFVIASPKLKSIPVETVGIHFVAAYRSKLDEFPDQVNGNNREHQSVIIHSSPARLSSPVRVILQDIARRF